ncbi:hypothetical protein LPC08_14610 [Roseomonas sp. OT10]|uniref:hypothetical protein n=1 Tax=Roseomonas cutis TaxID=2897332 RepID=UPI001E4DCDC0|nr:hypothetical protein [Roseomonas sp. OT10]UFN47258.1 hypothetical protein LPC08_14610 [Roseomonas sp. OT10]
MTALALPPAAPRPAPALGRALPGALPAVVPPPAPTGPDGGPAELMELVRDSLASGASRDVLWLRFSAMPPSLDRPHHRRLLREAAMPRRGQPCRLFRLPDGDLVVVTLPSHQPLEAALAQARAALSGAVQEEALGQVLRGMRLPQEAAALLAAVEECLSPTRPARAAAPAPPLDPASLAAAEQALAQADVWPLHARQMVCRLCPETGAVQALREDVRPLPGAVAERLLAGRDAAASPALASRLAEAIAARLLASLARPEWRGRPRPLHLPLPVAGLTSPAFLRLDAILPRTAKPMLMLGIAAAEILADPPAFRFARDFARGQGYRLALEVPGPAALVLMPPTRLGVEAVRIPFSPALTADPAPLTRLAAQAQRGGAVQVVLAGADSAAAIAWGWENGLRVFQGRLVQRARG